MIVLHCSRRVPHYFFWIALLYIAQALSLPAFAAPLELHVPPLVLRGEAFIARCTSYVPVESIEFQWLGKRFVVPAVEEQQAWMAEIMLPVPLESEGAAMELKARIKDFAPLSGNVSVQEKKRPVQELTVDNKFVEPPQETAERIANERKQSRAVINTFSPVRYWEAPMLRPVSGIVTSEFGRARVFNGKPRSHHRGVDLRGATGTPIRAAEDGIVAIADDFYYSGNVVYIDHGLGVVSIYAHLSRLDVKPGQRVNRGDIIGLVGATGRVTGPHLHYSLSVLGESVDPMPLHMKHDILYTNTIASEQTIPNATPQNSGKNDEEKR